MAAKYIPPPAELTNNLTERQVLFAHLLVANGGHMQAAAKAAGYGKSSHSRATELMRNPAVRRLVHHLLDRDRIAELQTNATLWDIVNGKRVSLADSRRAFRTAKMLSPIPSTRSQSLLGPTTAWFPIYRNDPPHAADLATEHPSPPEQSGTMSASDQIVVTPLPVEALASGLPPQPLEGGIELHPQMPTEVEPEVADIAELLALAARAATAVSPIAPPTQVPQFEGSRAQWDDLRDKGQQH